METNTDNTQSLQPPKQELNLILSNQSAHNLPRLSYCASTCRHTFKSKPIFFVVSVLKAQLAAFLL